MGQVLGIRRSGIRQSSTQESAKRPRPEGLLPPRFCLGVLILSRIPLCNTHLCVNFSEHEGQLLSQVAGFGPTQHVIGPQQARQPEHRLADHRQVLGGFVEGDALTGQDLATKAPNQDTQQRNLIRKDDFFCGFKALTFGEGEVFRVEAMLEGVRIPCLAATFSATVSFRCR